MGRYRVDLLKDGVCYNTGEMYRGCVSELGQSVKVTCLDANGSVNAIVTSNPIQCLDQAHLTYFDVDLTTMQIIGVKSTRIIALILNILWTASFLWRQQVNFVF